MVLRVLASDLDHLSSSPDSDAYLCRSILRGVCQGPPYVLPEINLTEMAEASAPLIA